MLGLLKRIFCFIFGHRTTGFTGHGITFINAWAKDQQCFLEVCPRCQQLWGKTVTIINMTDKEKHPLLKSMDEVLKEMEVKKIPIPTRQLDSVEFLLSELSDQTVKVKVIENLTFPPEHVEILSKEGKTSVWQLEFTKGLPSDEAELEVLEQLGNLLNKVVDPVTIVVAPVIFNYIDFPLQKVTSLAQGSLHTLGGLFKQAYGQANTQAGNSGRALQGQSGSGSGVTGTSGSGKF